MLRFLAELKRRKVIQTAVLYAVSAWVLLQVAELLLEMLEVPPWGLKLIFVLLLIGFPLALTVAMLLRSAIYGIRPWDPAVLLGAPAVLVAAAALATYLPARRATRTTAMEALRAE